MRARALHADVLVVTSALLRVNCVIVRSTVSSAPQGAPLAVHMVPGVAAGASSPAGETFVIDSPVLPDELDALPAVIEQARFTAPSGLLATHGDWDHLLGRLAFPALALGCGESTARRLADEPGAAQRELREFDDDVGIDRVRPLSLGTVQALPVPGRCELGGRELELHPAEGHTVDGIAIVVPWAGVLVAGDYLSPVEIPQLNPGGTIEEHLATLERLDGLLGSVAHVVPGHGEPISAERARAIGAEDIVYLERLRERGGAAPLPEDRATRANRAVHERNVAAL